MIDPLDRTVLADALAQLEDLGERTMDQVMAAARLAYMHGYNDALTDPDARRDEVAA